MAITTLSMVLTVFVLNLHHVSDRPVPPWARKVVLLYLARMLGICVPGTEGTQCQKTEKTSGHVPNHVTRRASLRIESEGGERTAVIELHPTPLRHPCNERTPLTSVSHEIPHGANKDSLSQHGPPSGNPMNQPQATADTLDYSKDWKRVAEVFDRLFFWLFLLAILISTLVLFHPLTDAYLKRPPT